MSRITLAPNASGTGTLTVAAPNTNTDRTITLPDVTTTLVGTDASQTLTNKSIASSQLTGALPAIDGSALTGIATGGMTLLGTLATTSGSSQTLSGLTLTSYKFLLISINGTSFASAAGTDSLYISNSIGASSQISTSLANTSSVWGIVQIDLTNKISNVITMTSAVGVLQGANFLQTGIIDIDTTATSIRFAGGIGGQSFDAGSIRIYGVK